MEPKEAAARRRPAWPLEPGRGPLLALAFLEAVLFFEILFGGRVLFERDIHGIRYPQLETFVRCVFAGSWPVWDPYMGFGQPMLANPAMQALYPWTWLNLLVSAGTFYTLYAVGHHFLAAVGLYLLGRRLGLRPGGALVAAALWAASGPLLSMVSLWHHFAGAAWLPWILVAADGALRAPSLARSLVWGAAWAGMILAGSADLCAMGALLTLGYGLRFVPRPPWDPAGRRLLGHGLAALAFALALSAGQWLPAGELLGRSVRASLPESVRTYWSLHPANLLQLFLPVLPRDLPLLPRWREMLFEGREPFLGSLYVGLASLALVLPAVFAGVRKRLVVALLVLAAGATLYSLGRHGGAYDALVALVPPLRIFRFPSKAMVLVALAWALLAGVGFDAAEGDRASRTRLALLPAWALTAAALGLAVFLWTQPEVIAPRLLDLGEAGLSAAAALAPTARTLVLSAAAAGAALALRHARGSRAAVAAIAVADLLLVHRSLNPTAPRDVFFQPPAALAAIRPDGPTRIYSFDYLHPPAGQADRHAEARAPILPAHAGLPPLIRHDLALRGALPAPIGQTWGLYGSYDPDLFSTSPEPLRNLTLVLRAADGTPDFLRLLRFGSVSYVIALHREGFEGLEPLAPIGDPLREAVYLFRVPGRLPRAYATTGTRVADGPAAVAAMLEPAFDPAREIVIPYGPTVPPSGAGTVRLASYRPDRVVMEAELEAPGHVVLADAYDPGWRAEVDGKPAPVLRANVAFRAVPVPGGAHQVVLEYRPHSVTAGLLLSAVAALMGVVAGIRRGLHRLGSTAPGTRGSPE